MGFVETKMTNKKTSNQLHIEKIQELGKKRDEFRQYSIKSDSDIVGCSTIWEFKDFAYVEHFATSPLSRGSGIGAKVMHLITEMINKPIILEVEPPEDEFSKRRINFYERCGYILNSDIE